MEAERRKRGRPTGHVKIEGDWESAVERALKKSRPGSFVTQKPAKKKRRAKRRKAK